MSSAVQCVECHANTDVDVVQVLELLRCVCPGPLTDEYRRDLNAICRKIHVAGTLLARYEAGYRLPAKREPLAAEHWPFAIDVLLSWAEGLATEERGLSLKLLNTAFAALDISGNAADLQVRAEALLESVAMPKPGAAQFPTAAPSAAGDVRTLPLTVLAYDGPCARAYLTMMRRAGLRPQKILLVVLSEHPQSRKPVGRWFPGGLRTWYAEKAQEVALNHWPRRIRSMHPELVRAMCAALEGAIERPAELIDEMYGPFRYDNYADTVQRVVARDLKDDAVYDALKALAAGDVLFTGGGILPARVVDIAGLNYLHVHPGHLPYVRGADGLLWSSLVNGQPAMSCFHLSAGLDTGDILAIGDYPALAFEAGGEIAPQTLYRAIFSFADPLLRAHLLVHGVLARDRSSLTPQPQDPDEGVTYHFMHSRVRDKVLGGLFAI